LIVGVNKMDAKDVADYKESRYKEVKEEAEQMLIRVGWLKKFVSESVPFIPMAGLMGENLVTPSTKMPWWSGVDLVQEKDTIHVHTLLDALEKFVRVTERPKSVSARTPISGIYKIKGIGDVLTGRVEQGTVQTGEEVVFLPTHSASSACEGKIFSIEMHNTPMANALPGDNCGFNIRGLRKENMPRVGDVMVLKSDTTIGRVKSFTAQVRVMDHPGELKPGYCPIAYVRTARSAVKMTQINWKVGRETGNSKIENPTSLKSNEMAEVIFEPQQPLVLETFKNCEGLGRVAIMEGANVIMLGKVTAVTGL